MSFTMGIFSGITFFVFFIYIFLETRVYLAIWAALFYLLNTFMKSISIDIGIYKITIASFVVLVLAGYLYVFRGVLLGKEKPVNDSKLKILSTDKAKQRRVGIAILILIVINITAIFIFQRG